MIKFSHKSKKGVKIIEMGFLGLLTSAWTVIMENFALIISILTTIIAVVSLQGRNMVFILICNLISNGLVVLRFAIANEFSSAWTCVLAVVQVVLIYILGRYKKSFPIYLTVIFCIGYAVICILNFQNLYDLLALGAAICFALSVVQKAPAVCRAYTLVNCILWLIFDIVSGVNDMIIVHGTLVVIGIFSMIRLDRGYWRDLFLGKR